MAFNLDFTSKTILSCFYFFFLTIDLYFLFPAAIAQIFNSFAEIIIPIGTISNEVKTEIEIILIIVEAKIRKCSI